MTVSDRPDDDQSLKLYYAQRASSYEQIYQRIERQPDLGLIRSYLQKEFKGRRVLDLACGTAFFTEQYAPQAHAVVGIDSSAETLSIARSKNIANARFLEGDAYRPGRSGQQFDAAFVGFFISHVPLARRLELFAELHSCLVPGALVVLLDNRYVEGNSTSIAWRDEEGNSFQDRTLPDGSRHRILKNYPQRIDLLESIGPIVSTHWWMLEYYWVLQYRRD